MRTTSHDEAMAALYRADPAFARQVLNTILEDEHSSQEELLVVLRQMNPQPLIPQSPLTRQ